MSSIRHCLLAFLILFTAPLHAASGDSGWFYRGSDITPDPAWQFGTLPNGLRYAIRRNALPAGQVSIRLRIDAGSLHEEDHEQGWAHFVEHMAFRGTKNFGDREARHIWQQLGASFGSDTNATTSATQTVYQLDLPHADRTSLDRSLAIISEMADSARFDPALVDAERKVVLAEKGRQLELATRYEEVSKPLFYGGLKYADRNTIGTDETLGAATSEGLRAFYERWYRPDRATLVIAGDADPVMLTELVAKHFTGWQASGPAPAEPDYGNIAKVEERVAALAYPGAPNNIAVGWLRPHVEAPDTIENEGVELAETLATQILNRRLEAKARGEASFISAGIGVGRTRRIADMTQLSLSVKEGKWDEALEESFAILADALRAPPSEAEIARELSNMRTAMNSAVAGESTIKSQQWAQHLVNALNGGDVVAAAPTRLALLGRLAPEMSPERIGAAMKQLFTGAGPRLLLLTPQPAAGGTAALEAALVAAEATAPATRQADRLVSFDALPPLGPPGKEVSREHIADLDVTVVRFANGSTLTYKPTDYEKGSVLVQLRFGNGIAGLSPDEASPAWTSGVVVPSGLADLDLEALERLLTGRKIGFGFGLTEDRYVLSGGTNADDLPDQLRLLASKLAFPRWDPPLFNRFKSNWLENYEMNFVSAAARAGREMGSVMRPGDARWRPVERAMIAEAGVENIATFFTPLLATGPIEAIIVGDVDLETALTAFASSVGALPKRGSPPKPVTATAPPRPDPEPRTFTHEGDANQAFALIGWSTMGGTDRIGEHRAIAIAAEILRQRLFDRLREEEGVTYSPSVLSNHSETFPLWGVFFASAELKPESVEPFFRIAREEVSDLATKTASAEEFSRAQNPIVSGLERRVKTNAYWLSAVEGWTSNPALIEQTRTHISDYRRLTPEDVRRAVAAHVADEGDWSMLVLPKASEPEAKAGGD